MRVATTTRSGPHGSRRSRCTRQPSGRRESHNKWTSPRGPVSDGNRVVTTATTPLGLTNTTTKSTWDTTQSVPELATETIVTGSTAAGTATRWYSYGVNRTSVTTNSTSSYYLYDGMNSVSQVTSPAGAPQWTFSYSPFGEARTTTRNDTAAPDQPFRFNNQQLDASGLYNLRARNYDPVRGRFTATDPLAPSIEDPYVSSYAYVNNRPTVLVDPTGEKGRTIGAVFGGIVDAGKGAVTGTSHLATNPTQLWRAPENAYRDFGGGWQGTQAAFNQFNPLYHGLNSADECMSAIDVGNAHGAGMGCTNLILDSAGAAAIAAGGATGATRGVKPPRSALDDVIGLSDDYIDITAKGSRVRNVQTSVGRSSFEQELIDSGFNRSVLTTNKNVVQYELSGQRYVVRDAATSTRGATADFYPAGSDAFTLKIRLAGQ